MYSVTVLAGETLERWVEETWIFHFQEIGAKWHSLTSLWGIDRKGRGRKREAHLRGYCNSLSWE